MPSTTDPAAFTGLSWLTHSHQSVAPSVKDPLVSISPGRMNLAATVVLRTMTSVSGLAVFDGQLYAGTGSSASFRTDMPRTKGMYRYEGGTSWISCGCPGRRIVHLGVYNGHLYGLSYDGGYVYRYEGGTKWTDLGPLPDTDQAYSFMVFQGKIHICTWPKALVLRFEEPRQWVSTGRLGEEKENWVQVVSAITRVLEAN